MSANLQLELELARCYGVSTSGAEALNKESRLQRRAVDRILSVLARELSKKSVEPEEIEEVSVMVGGRLA